MLTDKRLAVSTNRRVSSRSPFAKMNIVDGSILAAVEFATPGISMTCALGTGGSGARTVTTGVTDAFVTASPSGCSYSNGSSYGTKYEPKLSWRGEPLGGNPRLGKNLFGKARCPTKPERTGCPAALP